MVYVDSKSCDGCGLCVEACPHHAIKVADKVAVIDLELCQETGACLEACPQGALLQLTEPEERKLHPVLVSTPPPVKWASSALARPPTGVGTWLGAALTFLVSDVMPEVFRYWVESRRKPSSPAPVGPKSMARGRGGGRRKLRRRCRNGRGRAQ